MAFEFKLPDIGEGLVEGEIVKWLVKVGDTVREEQPIVEVMTDKATVEITSPRDGVILELRAKEGETVKVHTTFVVIDESGKGAAPSSPTKSKSTEAAAPMKAAVPTTAKPTASGTMTLQQRHDGPMILPPIPSHRVLAAPAVRKLAMQSGVDLQTLRGSGPYGRVLRQDVMQAKPGSAGSAHGAQATSTYAPAHGNFVTRGGPTEEIPLRGLRKRIAAQMLRSKQHVPHFTYVEEVDVTDLVALRKKLKPEMEKRGVAMTYLPFIFKAALAGVKKYPHVNASLDDDRGVLIQKQYYNFGISVATDDGLVVPVVKNVDKLDVWQIAAELTRLSTAARERKVKSEEFQDSTFTVTSIGSIGGVLATPIINYPDVAIMGVFKIRETPVVRDGEIVVRQMMYLATSFDHRVVDGDVAAHFCNEVVRQLQNPLQLLG